MNIEFRWLKPDPKSKEDPILQYRQQVNVHIEGNDWRTRWTDWMSVPMMYDNLAYRAWQDKEPVLS